MRTFALASGSSGNCFYIESEQGKKVLVDIGISFSRIKEILSKRNISIEDIDAVLITHEHSDHVLGLKTALKNMNCDFYISKGTYEALDMEVPNTIIIKNHDSFKIGDFNIFVVDKPHDSKEAISYVFENNGKKLGVFTDLGHVNNEIMHILKTLDIIYFEANYCEEKVKSCKDLSMNYLVRLMSDVGHLGLSQACYALSDIAHDNMKIILSHISENTNNYENAYLKIKRALISSGKNPKLFVSFQGEPTEWFE